MNSDKASENHGENLHHAAVYNEVDTMDTNIRAIDFDRELDQMGRSINYYKLKLQSCRDKYNSVEMQICNVRRLQSDALLELNNAQIEEECIQQRLANIHLSHETCIEKSGGHDDLDETIRAKINELTARRNALMQELVQLKKNADDNDRKLMQANAMITEQEEKNASVLRELKRKSKEITFIPEDIKERIGDILKHMKEEDENEGVIDNAMQ